MYICRETNSTTMMVVRDMIFYDIRTPPTLQQMSVIPTHRGKKLEIDTEIVIRTIAITVNMMMTQ
jgi:hypothetical protein